MWHWFLSIVFLLATLAAPHAASAAPATIDTSSSVQATANSSQRKTFFDTENEIHWAFYYNGTAIEYSYSADGVAWISAGTLPYNTVSFSAVFKVIAATSYVFVVAEANTHDIVLRRGELDETSITFDAELTVFDGSSASNRFTKPTLAISENNHLWVSSIKDFGAGVVERFQVQVRRSTNLADDDLSWLEVATPVGRGVKTLRDAVIMPQNGDGMYLISSADGSAIVGYTFDGADWSAANAGGDYSWFGFGASGLNEQVRAIAVSGGDLYVGGSFTNAAGIAEADRIAKWDGNAWSALGSNGTGDGAIGSGHVYALTISGDELYVGGQFQNVAGIVEADYVAKWDGNAWSALGDRGVGNGALDNFVSALVISGDDVYVGGQFADAGGDANADRIARWNTVAQTWNAMGTGISTNTVNTIAISGFDIYVGGSFTGAGGVANTVRIARWNGAAWNAMGSGISTGVVSAIAVTGGDIYVGGSFTGAGGVANTARIARWNGAVWNAVGSGIANGAVNTIRISGSNVYLGGTFTNVGGNANANRIVRRDTSDDTWNALTTGLSGGVSTLAISGSDLYVGGSFTEAGGIAGADRITKWDGTNWNALGSGGINGTINALTVSGSDLYIGGTFRNVGGVAGTNNIARWDGSSWHALGTGVNNSVYVIAVSGSDVYVGGIFNDAGGVFLAGIALWDGNSWSDIGGGVAWRVHNPPAPPMQFDFAVYAITLSGSDVYIGGVFNTAGGTSCANIARWDGVAWHALGAGVGAGNMFNGVGAISISGTNLYAGGLFPDASGVANTQNIAMWDGANWHALDAGLNFRVYALTISGSDLYAGGEFQNAAGIAEADYLAKWDGNAWSALGSNGEGDGALNGEVRALAISGNDLYVGGGFTNAAGITEADYVARWDGGGWNALGSEFVSASGALALATYESNLYVGRTAFMVGTNQISNLAYYGLSIANDADTGTEISAISDADGDVYFAYTNKDGELRFRRFDESGATWGDAVTLNAVVSSNPSLSYRSAGGRVTASWVEADAVSYSHAASPYESGDWAATKTLYNIGTNFSLTAPGQQTSDLLPLIWTNGVGAPYSVLAGIMNMAIPTVVISSTAASVTNQSPIPITVTFSKDVTGFAIGDIAVGNGTAGNFAAVDGKIYTADITPMADGVVTVDIAAGVAEDEFANDNSAATQLARAYDTISPTVVIASTQTSPTNASPVSITFEFSEVVTGFAVGDITVGNGIVGNFVAVDGDTYTANITPTGQGDVTVDVVTAVAQDSAGNDNAAATQFLIAYDSVSPTVIISSTATNPTQVSPIPLTFQFSEPVTGFAVGDVAVANATVGNFIAVDGDTYTASITPTIAGVVTVNIAAAAAIDSATNLNTAAAQFAITFEAANADSDGDGVSDSREVADGTNPFDSGSYLAVLPTSWCSDWNGFLGMFNVNEYVNLTSKKRVVVPMLFDIAGEAKGSLGIDLPAGAQMDLLVHDMPHWAVDSYGKVCSEVVGAEPGDVDGRMVYYKPNSTGYDFAFALPYYDGLRGRQFLTFNTMQPSADWRDAENVVANWVQLTNLEDAQQRGTLYFYGQDGSVIFERAVTLAPELRQDFSVHEIVKNQVGIVEWRPISGAAKFSLKNTRYYYDNPAAVSSFDAALQLEGVRGNGELLATLLDTRDQTAVLEVANVTANTISAALKIYDASGGVKHSEILALAPYASLHVVANQYLTEELGSATINGAAIGSILAVGMHYGRAETGGISHAYGLVAKQALGTTVRGSYNTYLGQSCELLLVNSTAAAVKSNIEMKRLDGTTVLAGKNITTPSYGISNFNACAEDEVDHYGVVTVEAETKNAIAPVIIRSGANGDYRFVTSVR